MAPGHACQGGQLVEIAAIRLEMSPHGTQGHFFGDADIPRMGVDRPCSRRGSVVDVCFDLVTCLPGLGEARLHSRNSRSLIALANARSHDDHDDNHGWSRSIFYAA
jgi:hypothetical protein